MFIPNFVHIVVTSVEIINAAFAAMPSPKQHLPASLLLDLPDAALDNLCSKLSHAKQAAALRLTCSTLQQAVDAELPVRLVIANIASVYNRGLKPRSFAGLRPASSAPEPSRLKRNQRKSWSSWHLSLTAAWPQ